MLQKLGSGIVEQVTTPASRTELLERARALDGVSLGELAARLATGLPSRGPRYTKGFVGELVQQALGAEAGNLDLPDFPRLGVELKTIPVDRRGRVRESTFVCTLDLTEIDTQPWSSSRVWRKLGCVLFVPVEVGPQDFDKRHLGTPQLWVPSDEQQALLRADWMLLVGRIAVGGIEEVDARLGQVLQLRPKAANARVRVRVDGPDRCALHHVPLGFYLRARFTEQLLWDLSSKERGA